MLKPYRPNPLRLFLIPLLLMLGLLIALPTFAQDAAAAPEAAEAVVEAAAEAPTYATMEDINFIVGNLWLLIAGAMVFTMHLGFACVESGLTRSKNTVNILFKNTMIICIGLLTYGLVGFNLMYPGFGDDFGTGINHWIDIDAISGFITVAPTEDGSTPESLTSAYAAYTWYTDFFFQAMFAATAATIVSGAVAGRIKLGAFLIFSTVFVGLCYPALGAWHWGGGWLAEMGFHDFAGSTLVHSVGGWGALVMAILLGPRIGKYVKGSVKAIPGHSMPLAAIGVFLLWFGWFGFNGGSVLSADPAGISLVLVTTVMAGAAGGLVASMTSWVMDKKPDLSMALNGILAGLVGITAGADQMDVWHAVVIGGIAGVIVYYSVVAIDRFLKIDDPVGAISVHLVCGIWGTLAVGIFGAKGIIGFKDPGDPDAIQSGFAQLGVQFVGVLGYAIPTVIFCLVVGLALKYTLGLRVEEEEEVQGLDIGEHGMEAYAGFQTFSSV
ncbi:MAG: ammonium transporter [Phycisphaerales bacterium JB063]